MNNSLIKNNKRIFKSLEAMIREYSDGENVVGICPAKIQFSPYKPFLYLLVTIIVSVILYGALLAVGLPEKDLEMFYKIKENLPMLVFFVYVLPLIINGFRLNYGLLVICNSRVIIFDRVFLNKKSGQVTYKQCLMSNRSDLREGWTWLINLAWVLKVPKVASAHFSKPNESRARKQYGEKILTLKIAKVILYPRL